MGKLGIVLGVLALAPIPVAIAAAWYSPTLSLLRALEVAVPVAFLLGLAAVAAVRRARFRVDRTVARRGQRAVAAGQVLAWSGLYVATAGAIALGFYGLLVLRG